MEIIIIVLLVLVLALLAVLLLRKQDTGKEELIALQNDLRQISVQSASDTQQAVVNSMSAMSQTITTNVHTMGEGMGTNVRNLGESMAQQIKTIDTHVIARQEAMNQSVEQQMKAMNQRLGQLETMNEQKLEALRQSMQISMQEMRQENAKKLDEIRGTVDEKLQTTLENRITESFRVVSERLEQVYKSMGEMQHLAEDVGGLKQVLSGVKTRGILGEIQLGAILSDILSPEQYDTNAVTIPGSRERVEFAVKLPGTDGGHVYLPIDSKFPGDTYMHLQDAQADGDKGKVEEARKALTVVLKKSAKDIRDKYVEPPHTTNFGILFLPFEGLYAEVVNMGLVEVLQREYNINVAGPSTMAALLNSLQMGFRTLQIQKQSNEVWRVLGEVKSEFGKFGETMEKMQKHLQQTSNDLEDLMGKRSRAIERKLRSVQESDVAAIEEEV